MRALVVRLDSFGDVLLAGPAVRAIAAHVTLLCGLPTDVLAAEAAGARGVLVPNPATAPDEVARYLDRSAPDLPTAVRAILRHTEVQDGGRSR